jgi:hypothetical protein
MNAFKIRSFFSWTSLLAFLPFLLSCSGSSDKENNGQNDLSKVSNGEEQANNSPVMLTDKEKAEGWEMLFNGEDLQRWRSVKNDSVPSDAWVIEEGSLVLAKKGGDIVTREKYGDFELAWDFKLTEGANSGIKYFVDTLYHTNGDFVINGPEYQIIDDLNYEGIKDDPNGVSSTASLYLLYAPENKTLNPAGQWNQSRIVARGNQVEHWLNGIKVVRYERGSNDFKEKMASTKFKDYPEYGQVKQGHILLTDHGDKVYFRNIKIRRL